MEIVTIIASVPKNKSVGFFESYRVVERTHSITSEVYTIEYAIESSSSPRSEWQTRAVTNNLFEALFALAYIQKKLNNPETTIHINLN